jgi:hypothetical protein
MANAYQDNTKKATRVTRAQLRETAEPLKAQSLQNTIQEAQQQLAKRDYNAVDRVADLDNQQSAIGIAPEPEHTYSISSVAVGTREVETQIDMLINEISGLENMLRVYLPESLYNCVSTNEGEPVAEGYYVPGNLNSPLLEALSFLAQRVKSARSQLRYIQANITV